LLCHAQEAVMAVTNNATMFYCTLTFRHTPWVTRITATSGRWREALYMTRSATSFAYDAPRLPLRDRREAGRILAGRLKKYAGVRDAVVAAIPRGGVVVGAEIAAVLRLPLTVFLVRKLGAPGQEELALGAITTGGLKIVNRETVTSLGIPLHVIDSIAAREMQELRRREQLYGRGRTQASFRNKTVILVDDGIATGAGVRVAIQSLREQGASSVVLAVPVGPLSTVAELRHLADEVFCLAEPENFSAVGQWYEDFRQVSDCEACQLLDGLYEHTRERLSA
jgi:putative phosphoribosyl transferase